MREPVIIEAGRVAAVDTERGVLLARVARVVRAWPESSPWWDVIVLRFRGPENDDMHFHMMNSGRSVRFVYRCAFEAAFRGWA